MGTGTRPAIAGTRTYRNHHLDSTRWDSLVHRPDDIVVSTPYKCGTTWMQRILAALIHGPDVPLGPDLSPWIDARFWGPIEPIVEAADVQTHRRFLKSHLALDGTTWDHDVSYVIVGRDLRDVFMSLLNHYGNYGDVAMATLNDADRPGEPIPPFPDDPHLVWRDWISRGWFEWETDGWPFWSAFHHLETWWTARDRPNVTFVHHADLLADPTAEIARLAARLDIEVSRDDLDAVVAVTSFDAMKREFTAVDEAMGGAGRGFFKSGMATLTHKGTNGRWRDLLTDDELAQYGQRVGELDPRLRSWLEGGRHAVGID